MLSLRKGEKKVRTKKERRVRNRTVAIDESGDLGEGGTKMFTIVATVIRDVDEFEKVSRIVTYKSGSEIKFSDAEYDVREKALVKIAECGTDVYDVSRKMPRKKRNAKQKEDIYIDQTEELLDEIFSSDEGNVVDLLFDASPITNLDYDRFVEMCNDAANRHGKKIDWIEMKPSSTERILQVHDYVTGAVGGHYEHADDPDHDAHKLFDIIRDRIKRK